MKKLILLLLAISWKNGIAGVDNSLCPENAPMRSYENECIPCSSENGVDRISKQECEKCAPMRYFHNGEQVCLFRHSPFPDKPLAGFYISPFNFKVEVFFAACDDLPKYHYAGWVSEESCNLCPNNEYRAEKCVLKKGSEKMAELSTEHEKAKDISKKQISTNNKSIRKKKHPKGKWNSGGPLK